MSKARNGLFVEYCAKDFLDGTQILDAWEELAYRRICDLIYVTGDKLADDDKKMSWMTKTGNRWKSIKLSLLKMEKIQIVNGWITNEKCQKTLEKSARNIAQKVGAAHASNASDKRLKNKETKVTAVNTAAVTDVITNQEPISNRTELERSNSLSITPPKGETKRKSHRIPGSFPEPSDIEWAVGRGLDPPAVKTEAERIQNWAAANAITRVDWSATWRNWILKRLETPQNGARIILPKPATAPNGSGWRQLLSEETGRNHEMPPTVDLRPERI